MFVRNKLVVSLVLTMLAMAVSAAAQVTHTYVGVSGNDANPCTVAQPCATVFRGVTAVDPGGKVVIIENGDYERFSITKPVTVAAADGVNASIVADIAYAAFIIGPQAGDVVSLRNLHFIGINSMAANGVNNGFGGTLNIDNCTFTGFHSAIGASTNQGRVFIHNSTLRNNLFGIGIIGPVGEGITRVTIDNCVIESNDTGASFSGKVLANIRDSVLSSNTSRAISVTSNTAQQLTEVVVDNCQINHNTVGILENTANGGIAAVWLGRSTITRNKLAGISLGPMSMANSLGNNTFFGNNPDVSGGTLTLMPMK